MINKLFQKVVQSPQDTKPHRSLTLADFEPRIAVHYGIPNTASIMAFDPIQRIMAIGTLDGRIKVIGGDNIEALLVAPKSSSFKYLEFLHNQGYLVSVSNENEVQVWDLEHKRIAAHTQWESNITAFAVIYGFHYMYIGDEYGFLSVLKYGAEEGNLQQLSYYVAANVIADGAGISVPDHLSIVGVLPQPCSSGNRVLIAYANGLIVLWDVTEDRAFLVRGCKDLQLKDEIVVNSSNDVRHEHSDSTSDNEQADKEISSLCWASSDGSVLAVGYVDGDVLLWNLSTGASTKDLQGLESLGNVTKLQLSSAERRLPVIVLHWQSNSAPKGPKGQLFVYGGDEIGSEEVLTILTLDWSSGIETLKCIARVDLTLGGSFADMSLVPNGGSAAHSDASTLFVLTNPGQLHFYDDASLLALMTNPNEKHSVRAVQFPAVIPTAEPIMTVGKLSVLDDEAMPATKLQRTYTMTRTSTNWPLTGGVPYQPSSDECRIKRIYIGGYEDGSVRVWDATFPVLSLVAVLGSQVEGVALTGSGSGSSVSALDFFPATSSLAVGDESGLVRLYRLVQSSNETTIHLVTETKHEVPDMRNGDQNQCIAALSLVNSPVRSLQFVTSGTRLCIGFDCLQVAMLDVGSFKQLFLADCISNSSSPLVSIVVKSFPDTYSNSLEPSENKKSIGPLDEVAFILTKDAHIIVMDNNMGDIISAQLVQPKKESIALSMYIVEGNVSVSEMSERQSLNSSQDSDTKNDSALSNQSQSDIKDAKVDAHIEANNLGQRFKDALLLLCCDDVLYLYSLKSVVQGEKRYVRKLELNKTCCWTTITKRDGNDSGLILVYQTGLIEVRSLLDFELVGETSINSILKWTLQTNMDKTMSSSGTGQITMVNGCEFAFVSLFAYENDFRIPESLPCLHDKVLAAASEPALISSPTQKKKQITTTRIFGDIIKIFNVGKENQSVNIYETRESIVEHLDHIFSRFPFSDSVNIPDEDFAEYNIDDIEIDEPTQLPSSSIKIKVEGKDKETERERLFEGGSTDSKPQVRTADEIRAKYRKTGDASSAALQAKDKLMERQEKLERLARNTEELQSGAENFSSLAKELAKRMENRKWWQI